jgi:hypothetical protein
MTNRIFKYHSCSSHTIKGFIWDNLLLIMQYFKHNLKYCHMYSILTSRLQLKILDRCDVSQCSVYMYTNPLITSGCFMYCQVLQVCSAHKMDLCAFVVLRTNCSSVSILALTLMECIYCAVLISTCNLGQHWSFKELLLPWHHKLHFLTLVLGTLLAQ